MSINKILDVSQSNTSNKVRVWDLIVDNSVTLPPGSTEPADISAGNPEDILVTRASVAQWTPNISPTSLTFNQLSIPQTALSCYSESVNTSVDWTGPSGLAGTFFAKYIRLGSLIIMSLQGSIGGTTAANGAWTFSGIPAYCRPTAEKTVPMYYQFTELGAAGSAFGQYIITIKTDGTAIPFGTKGTTASAPNNVVYGIPTGDIIWSLI